MIFLHELLCLLLSVGTGAGGVEAPRIMHWFNHAQSPLHLRVARAELSNEGYRRLQCALIRKLPLFIGMFPMDERGDSELAKLAVSLDGLTLGYIPEEERTEELCDIAMENNQKAFGSTPQSYRTLRRCLQLLKKNSSIYNLVPDRWKDIREILELSPYRNLCGNKPSPE